MPVDPRKYSVAVPERSGSCDHKTPYTSPQQARRQLDRFTKRRGKNGKKRGSARIYKCDFCRAWHVGSESF